MRLNMMEIELEEGERGEDKVRGQLIGYIDYQVDPKEGDRRVQNGSSQGRKIEIPFTESLGIVLQGIDVIFDFQPEAQLSVHLENLQAVLVKEALSIHVVFRENCHESDDRFLFGCLGEAKQHFSLIELDMKICIDSKPRRE